MTIEVYLPIPRFQCFFPHDNTKEYKMYTLLQFIVLSITSLYFLFKRKTKYKTIKNNPENYIIFSKHDIKYGPLKWDMPRGIIRKRQRWKMNIDAEADYCHSCTIRWRSVHPQCCATNSILFSYIFITKGKPVPIKQSLPQPLATINLICLRGFAYFGYFI